MAEDVRLVTLLFHYRHVGQVATCTFNGVHPPEERHRVGDAWATEQGQHDVWVHLAVEVPAGIDPVDYIEEAIDRYIGLANECFNKLRPGLHPWFEQ